MRLERESKSEYPILIQGFGGSLFNLGRFEKHRNGKLECEILEYEL